MKDIDIDNIFEHIIRIIDESGVSVGAWSRAAANNASKRRTKADAAKKAAEFIKNNTSPYVKDYVKPERALTKSGTKRKKINLDTDVDYDAYENAQSNVRKAYKEAEEADKKATHAEEVAKLNLPKNSKISANKLTNAARNSWSERSNENQKNLRRSDKGVAENSFKRVMRANNIKFADPSFEAKRKKEQVAKKAVRKIEDEINQQDKENSKKIEKPTYSNYGDREQLEDSWKKTFAQSKQAKTDHENAQILQGMKNKLEKIYNNSESLEELYEGLIEVLQETICSSTAVMAPYPVDVIGRPSPFGKKVKKSKRSHGEKRAPHTKLYEEYEKQSMGNEHSPMHKFKYKQIGKVEKTRRDMSLQEMMESIAEICEEIIKLDKRIKEEK